MRKHLSTSSASTECVADAGADSLGSQCAASDGMPGTSSRDVAKAKASVTDSASAAEDGRTLSFKTTFVPIWEPEARAELAAQGKDMAASEIPNAETAPP